MSRNLSNINKIFSRSESPGPDRLVDYVNQDMSEEEARKIEEAMVDDPFLSDAAEGIEAIGTEEFNDLLAELNADIDARVEQPEGKEIPFTPEATPVAGTVSKRTSGFRITAIAAAIILLFVAGYFFVTSNEGSHYHGIDPSSIVRSEHVQQDEFDRAGKLFEAKKFKEAAVIFEKISDAPSKLMAGHSYFNLGDYTQAATFFKEVIVMDKGINKVDAEYNLALCLVEQKQDLEARKLLQ